jgi:hypothetical protein
MGHGKHFLRRDEEGGDHGQRGGRKQSAIPPVTAKGRPIDIFQANKAKVQTSILIDRRNGASSQ